MNSTLKDERNPGQCLPRCREQKSLKFKRWLSKDDQRPLWNTWTTNKISLKRQMANQLNNQNKRECNNQQERQWRKNKRKCNNQWPKKCRLEYKRNQKNINSLLQTLEPTRKKNDCHNNSAELTFYHPQNNIKENPKTPPVEIHHMHWDRHTKRKNIWLQTKKE